MRKKLSILITALIVIGVAAAGATWLIVRHDTPTHAPVTSKKPAVAATKPQLASFNKTQYSLTDPASIWVIVNKQHPLTPPSYTPSDLRYPSVHLSAPGQDNMHLRTTTATAVEQLFDSASKASLNLQVVSGYRSYTYQQTVYGGYVKASGQAAADEKSARPGYSEHQTGLALDIGAQNGHCTLEACFGETAEGQWLVAHAYEYGFILRYPADKVAVTGYEYEPWHFRYVGTSLATEMHTQGVETLEEFFGVSGGTSYN